MNKVFTLLFICFFAAAAYAQPTKVVLVEEGTGTWCQWCPRGDIYGRELKKQYPDQALFVAIHQGDPMEDTDYWEACGLTGLPNGNVDRTYVSQLDPFFNLPIDMAQQLDLIPPAGISVTTTWDEATREMTMTVTAEFAEALSGDYRLAAIVVEDGITGPAPAYDQSNSYSGGANGPMGGYEDLPSPVSASIMVYNHVGRHLPGGYDGEVGSLPATINAGETHSHTYTYTLPDEYNEEYVTVIGTLVEMPSGKILNAGGSLYLPGYANAKPFFHSAPQEQGFLGLNYQYDIVTHDPEHDELTITAISNLPPGLSLADLGDGFAELTGAPTQLGTFDVTLNVNDGEWDVEQVFQITIGEPEEDWIQVGAQGVGTLNVGKTDIEISSQGDIYTLAYSYSGNQIAVYKYENDSWVAQGAMLSASTSTASLAIGPDNEVYVLSGDVVLKLENNQWEQIGPSIGGGLFGDLIIGNDGTLYAVSFTPPSSSNVVKFNGSTWETLGSYTDAASVWNRFKLDQNGNPVVIHGTDGQSIAYSEVAQWDGSEWIKLGGDYVEPASQTFFDHDVAITPNGDIYAALTIGTGEQKLNIYHLNNGTWEMIAENLAGGATESCQLEADAAGNIIVAFRDENVGGRTSVMKYDGTDWDYMGLQGFTNTASGQSLALDPNGIPYVAYSDESIGEKLSVKKFQDLTSSIFEQPEQITGIRLFPNPNGGSFWIEYPEGESYQIIDYMGRAVASGTLSQNFINEKMSVQLLENNLSEGFYFLKVVSGEKVGTVKFLVK